MNYLLHTLPGLGSLAWHEAETRLPIPKSGGGPSIGATLIVPGRNDIVLLRYAGNPRALLNLRVSEDVFALGARAFNVANDERGLRQIYAAVRNTRSANDALNAWRRVHGIQRSSKPVNFRVISREIGAHKFWRRDIGKAVADAIADGWPGRWRRVNDNADLEIWATLLERELLCGVRLSTQEMRQRGKLRHLPASLRPALAAAMVLLTEPEDDDVFLDPMAGAGTLLTERAAAGRFAQILGGDNSAAAVEAMRVNTRRLKGDITCRQWNARSLPQPDASVDKVAVNLPFGKQVSDETNLSDLYCDVLMEIERVLRPGGRLVALAGDIKLLEAARSAVAPKLHVEQYARLEVLGQGASICVCTKL